MTIKGRLLSSNPIVKRLQTEKKSALQNQDQDQDRFFGLRPVLS